MKFASISHLIDKNTRKIIPKEFFFEDMIISPEIKVKGVSGHIIALNLTAKEIMDLPREKIRSKILDTILFAQDNLDIDLIQLGALTTSVTEGGKWFLSQSDYIGYLNHGDSYTAAITCQTVIKALNLFERDSSNETIAIVGAYGIIGEAVTKILLPQFSKSILIGRRKEKFKKLEKKLEGNYEITTDLKTKEADIIVTATSHPTSLLNSNNLKRNVIVVDVSQPPNLSKEVCMTRSDVTRIDGGYVRFPLESPIPIPGMPIGKNFACFAEVIMQALENERENHIGSINLNHLQKTEKWGYKYGFSLEELTNFGESL